MVKEQKN